ncbi:MAG TPA: hypothetical protein VGI20_12445 [Rhizomicrobium sp.]
MICECCRRDVDRVRSSFWHAEARICRECLAQWCDGDNDEIGADAASVGNYVRLRHGLPPLAAALALLLLAAAPAAYASRHCLDYSEAARIWPSRALAKDGDGCWTYDHHPPRAEVPIAIHEPVPSTREPAPMDRWVDADLIRVELRPSEPDTVSQPEPSSPPDALTSASQCALFVALVLATVSVVEIATVRHGSTPGAEARRWAAKSRR